MAGYPENFGIAANAPAPTHAAPIAYDARRAAGSSSTGRRSRCAGGRARCTCGASGGCPLLHWIWTPWIGGSLESRPSRCATGSALGLATLRLERRSAPKAAAARRGRRTPRAKPAAEDEAAAEAAGAHAVARRGPAAARPPRDRRAPRLPRHRHHRRPPPARARARVGRARADRGLRLPRHRRPRSDGGAERHRLGAPRGLHPRRSRRRVARRRRAARARRRRRRDPPARGAARGRVHPWDATTIGTPGRRIEEPLRPDVVEWPELGAVVALGLTYGDHVRETGQEARSRRAAHVVHQHARAFAPGDGRVRVPDGDEVLAALDAIEPARHAALRERLPVVPRSWTTRASSRWSRSTPSTRSGSPPASRSPSGSPPPTT